MLASKQAFKIWGPTTWDCVRPPDHGTPPPMLQARPPDHGAPPPMLPARWTLLHNGPHTLQHQGTAMHPELAESHLNFNRCGQRHNKRKLEELPIQKIITLKIIVYLQRSWKAGDKNDNHHTAVHHHYHCSHYHRSHHHRTIYRLSLSDGKVELNRLID